MLSVKTSYFRINENVRQIASAYSVRIVPVFLYELPNFTGIKSRPLLYWHKTAKMTDDFLRTNCGIPEMPESGFWCLFPAYSFHIKTVALTSGYLPVSGPDIFWIKLHGKCS